MQRIRLNLNTLLSRGFTIFLIVVLSGCHPKKVIKTVRKQLKSEHQLTAEKCPNPTKPITILIHGTRVPPPLMIAVPGLVRQVITPSGLYPASELDFTYLFVRNAKALNDADSNHFPFENTYLFGWSGALSFKARRKAAGRLYNYISDLKKNPAYKNTPLTIITVSHGGNVGLNLGAIAQERGNKESWIDRLVMLCSPIQDATEKYANSSFFKKVYHLYSSGENVQIADPQGMYDTSEMQCLPEKFFSHRLIKDAAPHIVQAEIRYKKRTLCHVDFAMPHFTKRLPNVLKFLENEKLRNALSKNKEGAFVLDYHILKTSG
jgi:hypothetical protein